MMSLNPRSDRRRAGMTLIEILVVIAIIAVLVSLLVVGIMAAMGKGTTASARFDMQQLAQAIGKFNSEKGIYPPSRIMLYQNRNQFSATALDQASLHYIDKIWPNLGNFVGIKWAGVAVIPPTGELLEGDQCLCFFLGGIPSNVGGTISLTGFSNDPTNPAAAGGERKKYFIFNDARLFHRNNQAGNGVCLFPSFNDTYSVAESRFTDSFPAANPKSARPYVYFSCGLRKNGYDPTAIAGLDGISPYIQKKTAALTTYWNPDGFQLLCAGADGHFGAGGLWPPVPAATTRDNLCNFNTSVMGTPD